MDALTTLGRTLGFSFAAGINLYATAAILGLASRYGWVSAVIVRTVRRWFSRRNLNRES